MSKGPTRKTSELVEAFLKRENAATTAEIVKLGGTQDKINWRTFQAIIAKLKNEGKVRENRYGKNGRSVVVYSWTR